MSLADPAMDDAPGQKLSVTMNPAHADKLFAGSGHTFAEILALVDGDKAVPSFALPARLKATAAVERSQVESQNVAGILRGADPKRRDEFVVVSAHLDHLGIGGAVNGDTIYNGAMDNASGIAAILEVAASLHESGAKPARSILFVAVTGEEKGELGSRYFAAHPTVPQASIVANVNTDMFLPLFPLKTLMVLGLDESDLGNDIRATAKAVGVTVQADPEPQRNRFVRSDQVQLRQSWHSRTRDESRLRREHARSGHRGKVDRRALSRAIRRSESADRPISRRQVRGGRARSRRPHREPDRPSEVERLKLLQAVRPWRHALKRA